VQAVGDQDRNITATAALATALGRGDAKGSAPAIGGSPASVEILA
jgi:hypothetical protein